MCSIGSSGLRRACGCSGTGCPQAGAGRIHECPTEARGTAFSFPIVLRNWPVRFNFFGRAGGDDPDRHRCRPPDPGSARRGCRASAGVALGQLARQLDALGLAAGQGCRALAEADVGQADVHQGLQLARDLPARPRRTRAPPRRSCRAPRDVLALVATSRVSRL